MRTNILLVILLTILVPFLVSCVPESNADTPQPTVNFSVIASGYYTISGLPENRKIEVFTDQTSFNTSLYLYIQPATEHTVDFSTRRVVLVSLGERNTGGYSISVEKIEDFGDYIKAKILIIKPGPNCVVTQALTSPYEFIEIENVNELLFEEHVEIHSCL